MKLIRRSDYRDSRTKEHFRVTVVKCTNWDTGEEGYQPWLWIGVKGFALEQQFGDAKKSAKKRAEEMADLLKMALEGTTFHNY